MSDELEVTVSWSSGTAVHWTMFQRSFSRSFADNLLRPYVPASLWRGKYNILSCYTRKDNKTIDNYFDVLLNTGYRGGVERARTTEKVKQYNPTQAQRQRLHTRKQAMSKFLPISPSFSHITTHLLSKMSPSSTEGVQASILGEWAFPALSRMMSV